MCGCVGGLFIVSVSIVHYTQSVSHYGLCLSLSVCVCVYSIAGLAAFVCPTECAAYQPAAAVRIGTGCGLQRPHAGPDHLPAGVQHGGPLHPCGQLQPVCVRHSHPCH